MENMKELDMNALEKVAGGANIEPEVDLLDPAQEEWRSAIRSSAADRDWLTDGCAATVEPKSWCDSNDSCIWWDVTYDHEPANVICPKCGAFMYVNWVDYDPNPSNDTYHYKCKNCGTEKSY